MRRLPLPYRQLVLTLCALFLLGAQQAAFAHLIGHLGLAGQAVAQPADAAGHAVALNLSHVCTSCLAISALASGAPLPQSLPAVEPAGCGMAVCCELHSLPVSQAPPYTARAPPSLL